MIEVFFVGTDVTFKNIVPWISVCTYVNFRNPLYNEILDVWQEKNQMGFPHLKYNHISNKVGQGQIYNKSIYN